MRIVSFLPSATEIVYSLGLGDQLVGVTHECDFPPEAKSKPIVVRANLDTAHLEQNEIDRLVSQHLRKGKSLYQVDELLLKKLIPDLIITQNLCQVCAPSGNEVTQSLKSLPHSPKILWLTPKNLNDIFKNILEVGQTINHEKKANELVQSLQERIKKIKEFTDHLIERPKVFFMEWLDPIYNGGHWISEMIKISGGFDPLAQDGSDSKRIDWQDVLDLAPEIIILSPCGMNLDQVIKQSSLLKKYSHWQKLPAVQKNQVFAVDANAYFARPGPRIVEGIEILAKIIHPELFLKRR
ncbi:MAG: cobalamin-binding protein [Chlamydiae bacterium]|nr:cobalamin-binding protein [Chlamydiota bacterium]MBI3276295.1 cobalamin-binding protein [Chlamydiota bacterium]